MNQSNAPIANARVRITALTNVAQPVFAASGISGDTGSIYVLGFIISGGTAAEDVVFQGIGGSPVYFNVKVAANAVQDHNQPFAIPAVNGLEVITATAAGDVEVDVLYWKPGAYGLGV